MLYFAAATLPVEGGLMVTGSHNPPDHNGFKMVLRGKPFFGDAIQRLAQIAASLGAPDRPRGRVEQRSVFDDYVARLAQDYRAERGLRWPGIAAMARPARSSRVSSAIAGAPRAAQRNDRRAVSGASPGPDNPGKSRSVAAGVASERCDLGIGFDGDGDRIGVVDSRGRILWGDQLLLVLARDVLRRNPGAPILADVKSSQVLFDGIAEAGGEPVMMQTGHSLIKARLAETGAPLAGEMSGHIFFADGYYGFDDAVYVAVRLLDILARSEEPLDSMIDQLPPVFNTPEIRIECDEARKFAIVEEVKERLRRRGDEFNDTDGVRVLRRTAGG